MCDPFHLGWIRSTAAATIATSVAGHVNPNGFDDKFDVDVDADVSDVDEDSCFLDVYSNTRDMFAIDDDDDGAVSAFIFTGLIEEDDDSDIVVDVVVSGEVDVTKPS